MLLDNALGLTVARPPWVCAVGARLVERRQGLATDELGYLRDLLKRSEPGQSHPVLCLAGAQK
jgi:hypothetical protein